MNSSVPLGESWCKLPFKRQTLYTFDGLASRILTLTCTLIFFIRCQALHLPVHFLYLQDTFKTVRPGLPDLTSKNIGYYLILISNSWTNQFLQYSLANS